jgi:ribose-phosphate pyrophosphokinase
MPHTLTLTADDLNTLIYPDGQPHIRIVEPKFVGADSVRLVLRIRNPKELFEAVAAANAVWHAGINDISLCIPYLMGARSDRLQTVGHSVDLEVVAHILTNMDAPRFSQITVFDVHSDEAYGHIPHLRVIPPKFLVASYRMDAPLLVVPDKGAMRKIADTCTWCPNIMDYITCDKNRNVVTGEITLKVNNPQDARGRNCVIVDDICDGGGTFIEIAKQIRPYGPKTVTLIVSHGIFSKGLSPFVGKIDRIITSNSFADRVDVTTTGGLTMNIVPLPERWYEE